MILNMVKIYQKGISVIEILVASAILSIALVGIMGLIAFSLQISTLVKETTQANFIAQETIEATRNFRDGTDWTTNGIGILAMNAAYHLEKTADNPPKWTLVQDEESINGFSRKVIFQNVNRDANYNIVATGGTNDPDTKKATTTVSWKNKKVEIITYITNWRR